MGFILFIILNINHEEVLYQNNLIISLSNGIPDYAILKKCLKQTYIYVKAYIWEKKQYSFSEI